MCLQIKTLHPVTFPQTYPKCPRYLEGEEDPDEDKSNKNDDSDESSDPGSDDDMDREDISPNHAGQFIYLIRLIEFYLPS